MRIPFPRTNVKELSELDVRRRLRECSDEQFVTTLQVVLMGFRLDGWLSLNQVARLANTSTRSFQRRLAEQGENFSQISDAIRAEIAEQLLKSNDRSIGEIAGELGYSEQNNFSRAFRRWTGKTPEEFRQNLVDAVGMK